MSFEKSLTEELYTVSGLSKRVFPINAPESFKPPYVAYISSEGVNNKTLDGFLSSREVALEVNVICTDYDSLKTLCPGVILCLQSFLRRTIGTTAPVFVKDIEFLSDPVELYEQEIKAYRCVIEMKVQL